MSIDEPPSTEEHYRPPDVIATPLWKRFGLFSVMADCDVLCARRTQVCMSSRVHKTSPYWLDAWLVPVATKCASGATSYWLAKRSSQLMSAPIGARSKWRSCTMPARAGALEAWRRASSLANIVRGQYRCQFRLSKRQLGPRRKTKVCLLQSASGGKPFLLRPGLTFKDIWTIAAVTVPPK